MSSFHMVSYAQTIVNVSYDDCDTGRDAPQQTNIINILSIKICVQLSELKSILILFMNCSPHE